MEEAILKRIMPNSVEAERAVIGAMLLNTEAIAVACEMLRPDDFYHHQYGSMFETIVEMYEKGDIVGGNVDLVFLQDRLRQKDFPEELVGLDALRDILMAVSSSVNVGQDVQVIYEKAVLRRLIKVTEEISNTCYVGRESLETILDRTEKDVFELIQSRNSGNFVPIKDIVLDVLDRIDAASRSSNPITGIATGFTDLDARTCGLQPSDLVLIAARPSMGKTAFVLNVAHHVSMRLNKSTAIFSLEMSGSQLVNRMLAMEASVDAQKLRNGNLNEEEWYRIADGSSAIAKANLIIDDTPGISITELRSKCRKYKLEYDLQLIIIDYLQLMSGSGARSSDSRQQEISEISRSLKALARELKVPVVALSQLSRACESRPDHRPMMSDLRESGAIEQDADVVMFLYRDAYYNKEANPGVAEVIVAKQRNGPIGTVELAWIAEKTKFANLEYRSEQN